MPDTNIDYEVIFKNTIEKIKSYHPNPDLDMVYRAYDLAREAHGDQLRKSGAPYMVHPVSVAYILADLKLDIESISAGILHDVVEDTAYTVEDIRKLFSDGVADIVDGVTKLQSINYESKQKAQAESYRKMFVAMSKDGRVILVKIADRLHNMRTLRYMAPEKQKRIAQETLDIYAPITHKLGIASIKCELEDLCFRYLYEEEYFQLANDINLKQDERKAYVDNIIEEIRKLLDEKDIKYEISGRPKHFYSIYKKMVKQSKSLDQIYDLFAVRVLVESKADCYAVLGVLNTSYYTNNNRFKDYISVPKENGYQSLHNTLMGPKGELFEIQIRTFDMHKVSEFGVAAHWKYKDGSNGSTDDKQFEFIREVLELHKDIDAEEFIGAVKGDFDNYDERVYCFTPNGDLKDLAKGATTIDFAYSIHSVVGNRMIGAKVNGKIVPIDYELEMNDRVEIITSKNASGPNPHWLKIIKTSQARSKINQWFNALNKTENVNKGIELIAAELKRKGFSYKDIVDEDMKKFICDKFKSKSFDSLVAGACLGGIKEGAIANRIIERYELLNKSDALKKKNQEVIEKIKEDQIKNAQKGANSKTQGVILNGVGFTEAKFSKCCSPLPGDDIVAFTTRGRGITVHRSDCINVVNLDPVEKARLLTANWTDGVTTNYSAKLQVVFDMTEGIFVKISNTFQTEGISLTDLNMKTIGDEVLAIVEFTIKSKDELDKIINKLNSLEITKSVNRITT